MKIYRVIWQDEEVLAYEQADGQLAVLHELQLGESDEFLQDHFLSEIAPQLAQNPAVLIPEGSYRLAPIVRRPGKIVCIGLNYHGHAKEMKSPIPTEPVIFMKATSALAGMSDPVVLPPGSAHGDWEVELAIVIGRKALRVSKENALSHVAGYTIMNDYSERHYQKERGGQWTKGKSCDTFAPLGPCLVTPDELGDPQALDLWLSVNGQSMQNGRTADMIFDCATIVSYVSQFMSLHPGDIISTGTPAGVGTGHVPPIYLKAGDVVEYGISGIGKVKQLVVGLEKGE